jgi:hypothetical protein
LKFRRTWLLQLARRFQKRPTPRPSQKVTQAVRLLREEDAERRFGGKSELGGVIRITPRKQRYASASTLACGSRLAMMQRVIVRVAVHRGGY